MKILLTLVFALLASPAVSQMFSDSKPVEDTIYWRAKEGEQAHISRCIWAAKNGVVIGNENAGGTLISIYLTEDAVYELTVTRTKETVYKTGAGKVTGKHKKATCLEYKKLNRN